MSYKHLFAAFMAVGMMVTGSAFAAEPDTSAQPAPAAAPAGPRPGPVVINAHGPAGGTYPKDTFGVVVNYVWADKDRSFHGSTHVIDNAAGNRVRTVQNLAVAKFRYGLGNGWDIRTSTPIAYNDLHNNPKGLNKKSGIGDTLVILHKQILNQGQGDPLNFAAGVGIWAPTGGTNPDDIGCGAWGLWGELGVTYAFGGGRNVLDAEIGYLWRGHGGSADTYGKQSDLLRINGRYAYALTRFFDLGVEAQYEHCFQGDVLGTKQHNAYDTLFAGPSLTLKIPSWKATLGVSAQFPIYQCFENAYSAAALGEQFRLEAKLTIAF